MNTKNHSNARIMRIGGGFVALFSLVMTLLILFAIPNACSFVGGIQLIALILLFIIGLIAFIIGQVMGVARR